MLLTVDHGKWFAVAIAMMALGTLLMALTRARSWRWRTVGIALPLLACILIALGLAAPAVGTREVVILLDLSPSTRGMPWQDPRWLLDLARKRLGEHHHVVVVGFDDQRQELLAETSTDPHAEAWPAEWHWSGQTGPSAGTDIQSALSWRSTEEIAHPERPPAPRWVITDGLFAAPRETRGSTAVAWTVIRPPGPDVAISQFLIRSADVNG